MEFPDRVTIMMALLVGLRVVLFVFVALTLGFRGAWRVLGERGRFSPAVARKFKFRLEILMVLVMGNIVVTRSEVGTIRETAEVLVNKMAEPSGAEMMYSIGYLAIFAIATLVSIRMLGVDQARG